MTAQDPSEQPDVEVLRRLRSLDELLPALSGALDVRDVFARISEIAQKVLPHDMLALPLASEDRQTVVVYALHQPAVGFGWSVPWTTSCARQRSSYKTGCNVISGPHHRQRP
jgi:hypothetical protein